MVKLLFVHPPFCTPASPSYAIANMYSNFKANAPRDFKLGVLDLNVEFHKIKFKDYFEYFKKNDWADYEEVSKRCVADFNDVYSKNHSLILKGEDPDLFDHLLNRILVLKPEFVAFSIVYSSQVFYVYSLINKLKALNIKTIVGGPAVSSKLRGVSDYFFHSSVDLASFFGVSLGEDYFVDFSIFNSDDYFSPSLVLPLKTSSTCYYKKCAFCSHFTGDKYREFSLDFIERTIANNKSKFFFLVDDMIHLKRLLELAAIFKKHDVSWACQLKPTKGFSKEVLSVLKDSGLVFVMWGVESGSNRVLALMNKLTNKEDVALILKNSKELGVINAVYVMFGFPSESKEEFFETVNFLKNNADNIDLILSSTFGLQKRSAVYNNPEKYFIKDMFEEKRTLLDSKISYTVSKGLSSSQALKLRKSHLKELDKINKFPRKVNFFREHMFFF